MKKFTLLIITLILAVSVLFSATACSFRHPLQRFYEEMQETENYKITISFTMEGIGRVTETVHVDGNIHYYPENKALGIDEYYTETVDDYTIEYRKDKNEKWFKEITESDDALDLERNDVWNAENYEKVDGEKKTYKQKKNVIFDNFENVTITILKDSCVIECTMTMDAVNYDAKIVISDIGEISSLTLPEAEYTLK